MSINIINNNQSGSIKVLTTSPGISQGGIWNGSYLLDMYPGAQAAYSLRKLRSAYTGSAIRVRRSSDNAERDIGFTGDNLGPRLDETALINFVGTGSAFITTWYDQSGNLQDGYRTTAANQPRIVESGSIVRDGNRPTIDATNVNWGFNIPVATYLNGISQFYAMAITTPKGVKGTGATNQSLYVTYRAAGAIKIQIEYDRFSTQNYAVSTRFFTGSPRLTLTSNITTPFNTRRLLTTQLDFSVGTATLWENGSLTGFDPNYWIGTMDSLSYMTNTEALIGSGTFHNYNGYVQEIVIYTSNQAANKQVMEIDANRYYGIY
jgi:hypothetical protein